MIITQLFVDSRVATHPMVDRFADKLKLLPDIIDDLSPLYHRIKSAKDPWEAGKQILLLSRNQGPFLKKCPGTREYICCDYNILHVASYCTMDCSYCILQSYFHPPVLHYFVNYEDCFSEISIALAQTKSMRIGTGEFSDSLIWEAWSDTTPQMIDIFSRQHRSILELKTKTVAIDFLKGLKHQRKTILAWSLNTPHVIATQERRTASLKARLQAAAQCQSWDYPLAFHFDPMVVYPNCEQDYYNVVRSLFANVSADNIVWISMGTFRFMPDLKPVVQQRFPQSDIVYGEFVPGLDKKMRYFKPLRIRLYRLMAEWIREFAPQVTVYLCMEDETVWTQSMGFSPLSKGGLPAMLNLSAKKICGLEYVK